MTKILELSGSMFPWNRSIVELKEGLSSDIDEDAVININSPGGLVSLGIDLFNRVREHPGEVKMNIMGQAASMATYFALAGDDVAVHDNSIFMIHNVQGFTGGDYRVFRKFSAIMDSMTNLIALKYVEKTGTSMAKMRTFMDDETFLFGEEIKTAGFADRVIESEDKKDKSQAKADSIIEIEACVSEMKKHEAGEDDFDKIAAHVGPPEQIILNTKKEEAHKPGQPDKIKPEVKMDLEKLKAEHPELYAQIIALGKKEGINDGINQERARCKNLTEMRAKFPKDHSKAVIDTAIAEGHEMADVSINLMAADQVNAELEAAKKEETKPPANGEDEAPEMKDGKMTHTDHVDAQSDAVAKALGMKK